MDVRSPAGGTQSPVISGGGTQSPVISRTTHGEIATSAAPGASDVISTSGDAIWRYEIARAVPVEVPETADDGGGGGSRHDLPVGAVTISLEVKQRVSDAAPHTHSQLVGARRSSARARSDSFFYRFVVLQLFQIC